MYRDLSEERLYTLLETKTAYDKLNAILLKENSSITTDDVLKKMQEAYTKVLNSNIRIN
jgi:hypothetical protein